MIRGKKFVKISGKNIKKISREHYLREDIGCGFLECKTCEEGSLETAQCFYIPDTNIFLAQMTFLESNLVKNIIILQTVLDETRNRNTSTYKRIRVIVEDKEKNAYVFSNELFSKLHIEKEDSETINDRNDRMIRNTVQWYNKHIGSTNQNFFLITNDQENKKKALKMGLSVLSFEDYVKSLVIDKESLSLISIEEEKETLYTEYLSVTDALDLIKTQTDLFIEGILNINLNNCYEGFIIHKGKEIKVNGKEQLNRALNGDRVVLKLGDENKNQVVCVIDRKRLSVCCQLKNIKENEHGPVLVNPLSRSFPKIRIKTKNNSSLFNKLFAVAIDDWPSSSMYPNGRLIHIIGNLEDKNAEIEAVLLSNQIRVDPFTPNVMKCLPSFHWSISNDDLKGRLDFRKETVFSIDPPGCTDIDDALHIRKLDNGNFQVGIHIADVSHFVLPKTELDKEAFERATTVYLVDRRIDMLPSFLGTNLCSLHEGKDRLAFSCILEMNQEADIINTTFSKTIINSKKAFSYDEALEKLEKNEDENLSNLYRLSVLLREKRLKKGAFLLSTVKAYFKLNEQRKAVECFTDEQTKANVLVEEFMLCANISVARQLRKVFPSLALLRKHEQPDPNNFISLNSSLEKFNLKLDTRTPKSISNFLFEIEKNLEPQMTNVIKTIVTRGMARAAYFVTGTQPSSSFYHTGIATDIYTHFTSPIRRYADIVVHRLLYASITTRKQPITFPETRNMNVNEACEHVNYRSISAKKASREEAEIYFTQFFSQKTVIEEGYVSKILQTGFLVLIPKYGLESFVQTENLILSKEGNNLLDNKGEEIVYLLKKVLIKIKIEKGRLQLELQN